LVAKAAAFESVKDVADVDDGNVVIVDDDDDDGAPYTVAVGVANKPGDDNG
jgi:hypothetical protein